MRKFTKLKDLKKMAIDFFIPIILGVLRELAPLRGVAEKLKVLERGGDFPLIYYFKVLLILSDIDRMVLRRTDNERENTFNF